MATKKSTGLFQTVTDVLEAVHAPVPVDEIIERILKRFPTQAKNPAARIRSHLRTDHVGKTLVFLDRKIIVPAPVAMQGICFRVYLSPAEVDAGALLIYPTFDGYRSWNLEPEDMQLHDADGAPLAARAKLRQLVKTDDFGTSAHEVPVFELGDWFRACGVGHDDSLLITIDDWQRGDFRLQHEPAKQRRDEDIERQNQALADMLFDMLEAERSERLWVRPSLLTAYARLADVQAYPADHWRYVIEDDERLASDGYLIFYNDYDNISDDFFSSKRRVKRKPSAGGAQPGQDRQVYRFKAVLRHRANLWRRVEIQGKQTVADFDCIMRRAFQHDGGDHLGGFWKRVRRGKSNRFRDIDLGTVDPFGEGDGAEQYIAELGLKPGDEVKFVYDFGDWVEHLLTLEATVEPEAKAKYPRVVEQNKPRYQYCQACKAAQSQTVATWFCHDCSDGRRRVVLCEACLTDGHEDHYADEIVY
jgi:hypothetical protein